MSAAPAAVVLFAKAPVPGRVKTRLGAHLGPAGAAELQTALLLDTARVVARALEGLEPAAVAFCATIARDEPALRRLLPASFRMLRQGAGDLGRRLARTLRLVLESHAPALALGCDCPDLTADLVRRALAALGRRGAVLGPARDGGYWAIGLSRPHPEVFREIPWSTPEVAELTRRRFRDLGLPFEELPLLADVDRLEDLRAWARRPNPEFERTLAWWRARGLP